MNTEGGTAGPAESAAGPPAARTAGQGRQAGKSDLPYEIVLFSRSSVQSKSLEQICFRNSQQHTNRVVERQG